MFSGNVLSSLRSFCVNRSLSLLTNPRNSRVWSPSAFHVLAPITQGVTYISNTAPVRPPSSGSLLHSSSLHPSFSGLRNPMLLFISHISSDTGPSSASSPPSASSPASSPPSVSKTVDPSETPLEISYFSVPREPLVGDDEDVTQLKGEAIAKGLLGLAREEDLMVRNRAILKLLEEFEVEICTSEALEQGQWCISVRSENEYNDMMEKLSNSDNFGDLEIEESSTEVFLDLVTKLTLLASRLEVAWKRASELNSLTKTDKEKEKVHVALRVQAISKALSDSIKSLQSDLGSTGLKTGGYEAGVKGKKENTNEEEGIGKGNGRNGNGNENGNGENGNGEN